MKTTLRGAFIDGPNIDSYEKEIKRDGQDKPEKRKTEFLSLRVNELPSTPEDKRVNRWKVALFSFNNRKLELDTTRYCASHEKELKSDEHVVEMDIAINTNRDVAGMGGVSLLNPPRIVPATQDEIILIRAARKAEELAQQP